MNSLLQSRSPGFTHEKYDSRVTKDPGQGPKRLQPVTLQLEERPLQSNTIGVAKTTIASPFLQHSGLTPGQKRYLYNVEEAYNRDHVRNLIRQHYLNVLHRSISTGVSPTKDMSFNISPHIRICTPDIEHSTEEKSQKKGKANGLKVKTATSKKAVSLPKINSHRKSLLSKSPTSNRRKSVPPLTKKKLTSSKSVWWEMDLEKKEPEQDSVISDISLLSLENESFLYIRCHGQESS